MLGKRPYLLHTTSTRSLLVPCEDTDEEPTTCCNDAQISEKKCRAAQSAPCKIVIGFNLGAESKPPTDVCESPRSVLDAVTLLPSQEKQHTVERSPRSGLGSLLTASSASGDGLEIAAQIKDKEVGVHAGSVAGSFEPSLNPQNCLHETRTNRMGLTSKSCHGHSKDSGSLGKASDSDFMDDDIPPRRSQALFVSSSRDMNANCAGINSLPYQSSALDAYLRHGCLDADGNTSPQCGGAPRHTGTPHVSLPPIEVTHDEHIKSQVFWRTESSYGPGSKEAVNGCTYDHSMSWSSETRSLCEVEFTGSHISPWQTRQSLHELSIYTERPEIGIRQSIFSAASPPCFPLSGVASSLGFLRACAFCGHPLLSGRDIFMYRGDQAFCSVECRYQKIVLDEGKEE